MTVPPIILLSVWEQSSSSTGNNASQPQTSSAPTVLPTAPPTSLSLSPSRQFYTSLLCLSLFPFFSSVFSPLIFIKPPLQPTFLESHACMWQCFLWHLPLCYVVCNYRLCAQPKSPTVLQWKGSQWGLLALSQSEFGLCDCIIMPIPRVSICISCCLVDSIWVGSIRERRKEEQSERGKGLFAQPAPATIVLVLKWMRSGQVHIYEFFTAPATCSMQLLHFRPT